MPSLTAMLADQVTGGKVMSGKTQALRQPCGTGAAFGCGGAAFEQVGLGRVLPTHVRPHVSGQGRHCRCP